MEIKRDWLWKKYTITAEDKLDEEALQKFNKYIDKLEEENKKLKLENWVMKIQVIEAREDRDRLTEENKTLKEKLSEVTMIADDEKQSIEHILELEEENKKLNGLLKEYEELLLTKNVCNENYYTRKEIIEKINDKRNEI